jgi:endogenous inhibitor of DNA gyrase (YacG/DUF329 family)
VETCPSCGRELPGEFSFCPFCGDLYRSVGATAYLEHGEALLATTG